MKQVVEVIRDTKTQTRYRHATGPFLRRPVNLWGLVGLGLSLLAGSAPAQTVPSTFRLDPSLADTSKPGFVWRVHQVSTSQPNNNARTEEQLAGLLGNNIADPNAVGVADGPAAPASPATAPISFDISGVLNLNKVGGWWEGWFGPDDQMPGMPGTSGGDENVAAEALTWLDLPAGWITLVVNSDDGFRLTLGGATPQDQFAMLAGEFNGGRGPEDTFFSFYVEQAGLYPARCTWEQGCCGASIEIASFDWWTGNRILINDVANGGIPAYRAVTEPARAYARRVSPANGQGLPAIAPVIVELVDGASPIDPATIQLSIDGAPAAVTRSKAGNVTTITYNHVQPFVPGGHSASFAYVENGVTRTVNWSFTSLDYVGPNGNFYEFVPARGISWEEAKAAAEHRSFLCGVAGHLVTITSQEEDVFVEALRQQYASSGALPWGGVWAGGFQLRDQAAGTDAWFWVNNEGPIPAQNGGTSYSNWNPGTSEPNDCCGTSGVEDNEENYLELGYYAGAWIDDDVSHNNVVGFVVEYERPVTPIDIKPGSANNPVYLDRPGKLPVAVLSTATFNAATIDLTTVRFGKTGTETTPLSYSYSDVNGDKRKDLVCQFNAQDTGLLCGDSAATLTATTITGCSVKGTDTVTVLGCPPYALAVTSMQDVNHVTDLVLKVAPILPSRTAPTVAQNIVLKSSDIFGHPRWSKTLQTTVLAPAADGTSSVDLQYGDVEHGQNVQAKMQVTDTKTGVLQVLTAEGRTVYRPDLAVVAPTGPLEALKGQIVNIFASVNELKGDLAASANVYLKDANNNVLDVVQNVYVGPHGTVGVMFTTIFGNEGVQNLAIEVADVNPGDYDPSNNRQSFTLTVGSSYYYAQYNSYSRDYLYQESNAYWLYTYSEQYTNEYVAQSLAVGSELQFPIGRVTFDISTDGIHRGSVDLTDVPLLSTLDYGCEVYNVGVVNLGDNTQLYIQSYRSCWGYQQNYAAVSRTTYSTVYYSQRHYLIWGGVDEYSSEYLDLAPWDVRTSIETRFVVEDDAGTFGGNGNFGPINFSPFDNSWDYWTGYYEPNDTHVTGYYRGHNAWGYNSGMPTP